MINRRGLLIYMCIGALLMFFTWQGITIFTLGYRIEEMSEKIRTEEIRGQQLLREYGTVASLYEIDRRASVQLGMKMPSADDTEILPVKPEKLYARQQPGERMPIISYLREVFLTPSAEARQ